MHSTILSLTVVASGNFVSTVGFSSAGEHMLCHCDTLQDIEFTLRTYQHPVGNTHINKYTHSVLSDLSMSEMN